MGKKSIETLVGLFVLLGIAALVFLALKAANLGGFSSGDTYTLHAKFDNIGGLKVRAPVRSAGVKVGRVASITLDPKTYQGVVRLDVEPTSSSRPILRRASSPRACSATSTSASRPGARRRRSPRRHDQADPVRGRAREPDRPVPVQQGRGRGVARAPRRPRRPAGGKK